MITARPATRSAPDDEAAEGPQHVANRHHRREERQRKVREQLLIGLVLLVLLIITVVLLGTQWLDSATTVSSSLPAAGLTGGIPT